MKVRLDSRLLIKDPAPEIMNQAVQDNTHTNPAYAEAKRLNRDTTEIAPLIVDYEFDASRNILYLPRGYQNKLNLTIDLDKRTLNPVSLRKPLFELRDYQLPVGIAVDTFEEGVIIAPTGAGKTVMAMNVIYKKQQKTLILVHTTDLLEQWSENIEKQFGFTPDVVAGVRVKTETPIVIGMFQTASSDISKIKPEQYGLLIVDECHHVPAETFSKVVDKIPAFFRYGVSATVKRRDGLAKILFNRIGGVIANIPKSKVREAGGIIPATIKVIKNNFTPTKMWNWNSYLERIQGSESRNKLIAELGLKASARMQTLILVDRIEHAKAIHKFCGGVLIVGSLKRNERKAAMEQAKTASLTVGTYKLLGEGIDIPGWQAVILGSPVSDSNRILQIIGRVIRSNGEDKKRGYVADIVDDCKFAGGSFNKRLEVYRDEGYPVMFENVVLPKVSAEELAEVTAAYQAFENSAPADVNDVITSIAEAKNKHTITQPELDLDEPSFAMR